MNFIFIFLIMEKPEKIKFKYIFQDDYNPKYVNGAFGGIGPQGEIVINFYLERVAIPKTQTFNFRNGQILEEVTEERTPRDHDKSIVRVVESGIILDLTRAEIIHEWLGRHIDDLKSKVSDDRGS